jgi:hypothetical protein
MKANENWIDRLERKSAALYSTVIVVQTNDDRRIKEYVQHLVPNEASLSEKKVVIYDSYNGLTKVKYDSDRGVTEVPETGDEDDMFGSNAMKQIRNILDAETAKGKTGSKRGLPVTVVLKNMLAKEDVKNQALNLFSTADDIMGFGHRLVLFTPDKGLVNPQVLEKCQLIEPPLSLPSERRVILEGLISEDMFNLKFSQQEQDQMVNLTGGLDLNQTEGVLCETLRDYMMNGRNLDLGTVSQMKADQINKSSALRVKANVKLGFERVGGYPSLKQFIYESIILPMKEPERARALGIEQPKGAIIFGPPGTGKTIFAEALAKELGLPFVTLDPENFMSSYVGESERNLSGAIKVIEAMAPVVVFIDESMNRTVLPGVLGSVHPIPSVMPSN